MLYFANRVHESASGSGVSNLTLVGALAGKATFTSKIATGSKVPYVLLDGNGVDWEVGIGTLASATELQRTTVKDSSATETRVNSETDGTPIKLNLSTNSHEVFIAPFHGTVFALDENGNIADPSAIRASLFVDTIAAMTALEGLAPGETVFVRGSAALLDGLGGCFYWDPEDAGAESAPDSYEHDTEEGLFKKVRFDMQGLYQAGLVEVDAVSVDATGGSVKVYHRKKATATHGVNSWSRWLAEYTSSTVHKFRLGMRTLQASAEKFFLDAVSTGDNFDRVEILEPVVLPSRANANGLKARALSWLSGVSRLALAQADAAASGSAADAWEIPLTKGGYIAAVVPTIAALKAIDPAKFVLNGDCALVMGGTAIGDIEPFYAKWSSASSATGDDWNVFRPTTGAASSGNGRWLRINVDPRRTFTNSDATPSIANGKYFITASTAPAAITDFDDAYEGQAFTVERGAADQVITHNASVIDLGGDDITLTAANPRASFIHVGGVHKLVFFAASDAVASNLITPERYGAVGDGIRFASGAAVNSGSASCTLTGASISAADHGKAIVIAGAGVAGAALITTIQSGSGTSVTLATTAGTTVTNAEFYYGTDDTAAWEAADAARLLQPAGCGIVTRPVIYLVEEYVWGSRLVGDHTPDYCVSPNGRATLLPLATGDALVAPERWTDGSAWPGFSNSPMIFRGIKFDAFHGTKKWARVDQEYQGGSSDCEYVGGANAGGSNFKRGGGLCITRQNQRNDVIRVTGNVSNGSPTITNLTFVSANGDNGSTGLGDIKLRQLIDGTGFVASLTNSPYITGINVGAQTLTLSQNANASATGATFYINRNGCGNRTIAEQRIVDNYFHGNTGYDMLALGTVEDPLESLTDSIISENWINGEGYGVKVGACFGIEAHHNHVYGAPFEIGRLGQNHSIAFNQFEDDFIVGEIASGALAQNVLGPGNRVWGDKCIVRGKADSSAELLIIPDMVFSRHTSGTPYATLELDTAQPNKRVMLFRPNFQAGRVLNSTPPISITSAGVVEVIDGFDGDGFMGRHQVWRNDATGVTSFTRHESSSPAASDVIEKNEQQGRNSAGEAIAYTDTQTSILDATDGSEDGARQFYAMLAGVRTLMLTIGPNVVTPRLFSSQVSGGAQVGMNAIGEGTVLFDFRRYSADNNPAVFAFYKARGTIVSPADVSQFDELGRISAGGYGSSSLRDSAYIRFFNMAATFGSSDAYTDIRFSAALSGSASITEQFRIGNGALHAGGANVVIDASRGLRLRAYTAANIADITHAVNTTDKAEGKCVLDTTNHRIMVARGNTANALWDVCDGSASVTPA